MWFKINGWISKDGLVRTKGLNMTLKFVEREMDEVKVHHIYLIH
jgi:hypothetical protein